VILEPAGADVSHPTIQRSALFPLIAWCCCWPIALADRTLARAPGIVFRLRIGWALGCVLTALHVAIAFHVGHGWSHEAAWQHTKQVGGYGDGVYVNYLFALVWLADAIWCWVAFDSYRARPGWLNWSVHGFLAFVVFNAAVVFGSADARAAFVFFFVATGGGLVVGKVYERRTGRWPDVDSEEGGGPHEPGR
jgi:hypothetical protein